MRDSDYVFGIVLGGEARAYPLRIMDWHEMANDVVGGAPVSIPYCTLCGSAIAYNPKIGETTYTFGSSGLLYRSNKLMYDHNTQSLWSALSGEPVAGKLVDRDLKLEVLPIVRTTWGEWKRKHPETTVLDIRTGHDRDYNKEPYKEYFESSKTMFPVPVEDSRVALKEFVFALRIGKIRKAYPLNISWHRTLSFMIPLAKSRWLLSRRRKQNRFEHIDVIRFKQNHHGKQKRNF